MIGVMVVMVTSFEKGLCQQAASPRTVVFGAPDLSAGHCQPTPSPETPGHSQASLAQSLVGSLLFLLGPGAHKVLLCPLRACFPGCSQSFCGSQVWEICCGLQNFCNNVRTSFV